MKKTMRPLNLALGLCLTMALPLTGMANNLLDQLKDGAHAVQQSQRAHADKNESMPGKGGTGGAECPAERGLRSVNGNFHTQVRFVNDSARPLQTYWLDYQGKRVAYKVVPPHGSYTQPTYLTHPWVVTDEGRCLGVYFPDDRERTITLK